MPTYQYACKTCDHQFETVQSFSDDSLTECPECSGTLRKLYGSVGVVFKGSGFYRNDSRGTNSSSSTGSSNGASDSGSGNSESGNGNTSGESGQASSDSSGGSSSSGSSESSSSGGSGATTTSNAS